MIGGGDGNNKNLHEVDVGKGQGHLGTGKGLISIRGHRWCNSLAIEEL